MAVHQSRARRMLNQRRDHMFKAEQIRITTATTLVLKTSESIRRADINQKSNADRNKWKDSEVISNSWLVLFLDRN